MNIFNTANDLSPSIGGWEQIAEHYNIDITDDDIVSWMYNTESYNLSNTYQYLLLHAIVDCLDLDYNDYKININCRASSFSVNNHEIYNLNNLLEALKQCKK